MVAVAPLAAVTTEGLLNITPSVAARSIVAPDTEAFPLVSAKTVNVTNEVPSAFKTVALELILIAATVAFAVGMVGVVGVVGVVDVVDVVGIVGCVVSLLFGVPALPPPPPQAVKAAATDRPTKYLEKLIFIFQFNFNSQINGPGRALQ